MLRHVMIACVAADTGVAILAAFLLTIRGFVSVLVSFLCFEAALACFQILVPEEYNTIHCVE